MDALTKHVEEWLRLDKVNCPLEGLSLELTIALVESGDEGRGRETMGRARPRGTWQTNEVRRACHFGRLQGSNLVCSSRIEFGTAGTFLAIWCLG